MTRGRLYTIAPHADFLGTLADRILDGTLIGDWPRKGPFWLTDITIVLPTRRARLALAAAFSARGHALLPDIRALGGELEDEEPFLPPTDEPLPPPAASRLERQLALAHLVDGWARTASGREVLASPPHPAEILRLAELMGELIDDVVTEGADIGRLEAVVAERDLADNWRQTAELLKIAFEFWPRHLKTAGRIDASDLRNRRLDRQARAAPLIFGDRPVIAAGSTGSVPATARLLAAIRDLPRGALVLPGLDTSLTPEDEKALADESANPHGHPQYGLVKLLRRLRAHPADVVELAAGTAPRTAIVNRALALAEATAAWSTARAELASRLPEALEGLSVIAAANEDEEARAVALAARDGLSRAKTIGIVTPDRGLARRIAAELARHGIEVDDAAGTPLFQSPAGRLVRQVLAAATSSCAAVDLMALLRNRAALFGLGRAEISRLADRIDLGLLRGQRPGTGIAGLRAALEANIARATRHPARRLTEDDRAPIAALLDRLEAALAPVAAIVKAREMTVTALCAALVDALREVTEGAADADLPPGMAELEAWAAGIAAGPDAGPCFAPVALDSVLAALMAGIEVRNTAPGRDDIVIWGELEARLQSPDLMILAGLNEDVWPRAADPGPWLSRGMRLAIGLEPPERRQGLAAHDFAMALGRAEIVMAFSGRLGTSPARPSRYVQRLEAFIGGDEAARLRARGEVWREDARRLDAVERVRPAPRPMPAPPAALRPKKLSVTEIETLVRSPYDLYARHVLCLAPIEPLGATVTGRERGIIIHEILARFVTEGRDFSAPDAVAVLMEMAREAFAGLEAFGERRDIWLSRFEATAEAFLAHERARAPRVGARHAEIRAEWAFPTGFRLTGRADRIDEMADGTLAILDFKTGSLPAPREMQAFLAPQLLLEAALARAGAFEGVEPAETGELGFIKIGLGPRAFTVEPFKPNKELGLAGSIEEVWTRLARHVDAYLFSDKMPMVSHLLPEQGRRYRGDYDHLARLDEWAVAAGDEDQ